MAENGDNGREGILLQYISHSSLRLSVSWLALFIENRKLVLHVIYGVHKTPERLPTGIGLYGERKLKVRSGPRHTQTF